MIFLRVGQRASASQNPWDANAPSRAREIDDDASYRDLVDTIVELLGRRLSPGSRVLDAGCGVGVLTRVLYEQGYKVAGIDPSNESIEYARTGAPELTYESVTMEEFARIRSERYDAVIANMVLQAIDGDLVPFLSSARSVMEHGGLLVCSVPHPQGFLHGKRTTPSKAFEYHREELFSLRFKIRGQKPHPALTPFFHRKLSTYLNAILDAGFAIERAIEPAQIGNGRRGDILFICATPTGALPYADAVVKP